SILGKIVIAERSGLIRIVEDRQQPLADGEIFGRLDDPQVRIESPGGGEVLVHLLLKRRYDLRYLGILYHGALIDDSDFDIGHGSLRMLMTIQSSRSFPGRWPDACQPPAI